jgi:hypothetical protein
MDLLLQSFTIFGITVQFWMVALFVVAVLWVFLAKRTRV